MAPPLVRPPALPKDGRKKRRRKRKAACKKGEKMVATPKGRHLGSGREREREKEEREEEREATTREIVAKTLRTMGGETREWGWGRLTVWVSPAARL